MMKNAKPIIMIFIMMLICCSYSLGQSTYGIGSSGLASNVVPGTYGISNNGAGVLSIGQTVNSMVYLGGTRPSFGITLNEFVCNSMSACGMYERGIADNSDSAIAYVGGVESGATVPVTKL